LENQREKGWVHISIWEETDEIWIKVADNGIGFTPNKIKEHESSKHNQVALHNIDRRIKLLYGANFGLKITSVPGEGTEILMIIPINTKQSRLSNMPNIPIIRPLSA